MTNTTSFSLVMRCTSFDSHLYIDGLLSYFLLVVVDLYLVAVKD